MSRTLSASNQAAIGQDVARPLWLVTFGFASPIRLSSRETLTFDLNSYTGTKMDVDIAGNGLTGSLRIFDGDETITDALISEGAIGTSVNVWQLFGDSPWSAGDEDLWLSGEIGASGVRGGYVNVAVVQPEERFAPRWYMNRLNGFSHIPPDGTEIATQNGIIVLRRNG